MTKRWRAQPLPIIAGLAAWLGLLIFFYPTVASWISQYSQSQLVDSYSAAVQSGVTPPKDEQLRLAHEYNDALTAGALLEANRNLPTGQGTTDNDSLDYWEILRAEPLDVMARLRIPAIDLDLPIFHGTDDDTLNRGVGHLEGTSLSVGGAGTHSVLTAHRGLANATMFTHLDAVRIGDTFTIEVLGEVLSYKVRQTTVVDPDQTELLRPIPTDDLVTLVTCTPLGVNTQRILVTAERITPTPAADLEVAGNVPDVPGFPWWSVVLALGTAATGLYVWRSGLSPVHIADAIPPKEQSSRTEVPTPRHRRGGRYSTRR